MYQQVGCAFADSRRPPRASGANTGRVYLCIDLKSFYASVECVERGRDPFEWPLVVADPERGRTTICLAASPAIKRLGVPSRCRLYEIPRGLSYEVAPPRMRRYMEVSAQIYSTYLRYLSADDIHVYSIDECFIDATGYLDLYGCTPRELAVMLMGAVKRDTGIPATAGIGTNLFLAKVALDVLAKHAPDGIGVLDEAAFRASVQHHRPITDIWGIGSGTAARLERYGVRDLAGVEAMRPDALYRELGVGAEYLIDHASGREPCTIAQIKAYEPSARSLTNGQVLPRDYDAAEARTVLREMADGSALDLVEKGLVASGVTLFAGYSGKLPPGTDLGGVAADYLGGAPGRAGGGATGAGRGGQGRRRRWAFASGSMRLERPTSSAAPIQAAVLGLYDACVDRRRLVRRVSIALDGLVEADRAPRDLFFDPAAERRERDLQRAVLAVKGRFGKNALVKGVSLHPEATGRERNEQIGGHRA